MAIFGLSTRKETRKLIDEALKQAGQKLPGWLTATAAAEQYNIPDGSQNAVQSDLFRKLSYVHAAVHHTSSEIAITGGQVMRRKGEESETVPNHPFELLLQKPNPLDSHYEFMYATSAEAQLTGSAYWYLNRPSEKAPPDELWLIPTHMITPVPDGRMYLRGYKYHPGDGQEIALEPWQICHFKNFNPFSRFVGLSEIESLVSVIATTLGIERFNKNFYNIGGGITPAILTFANMINDDTWAQMQDETKRKSRDNQFMMLRGVGQGDVNILQRSTSQKDQELLGQMQANKEEIFMVMAPGLASMLAINATEANALSGRATFKERSVYPRIVPMAEKITTSIMPAYGEEYYYKYDDIRWSDRQMELAEMGEYGKTHTVEEIRRRYYQDKPLGDDRDTLLPAQVKPEDGRPEPPEPEPQPIPHQLVSPDEESEDESEEAETGDTELSTEQIAAMVELDRWEEKTTKAGKLTRWHPVYLARDVYEAVKAETMTFQEARDKVKGSIMQKPVQKTVTDYTHLIEAMRLEVEGIKAANVTVTQPAPLPQPVNVTVHNHPGEAPNVTITQAAQDAPVVNIAVDPTPIQNTIEVKADKPDETNAVLKAIRKIANE